MPPATAASKPSVHAAPPRLLEQLGAVVGEQRLVGGDHVLAGRERPQDERARGLEPADQLDDDLDRRVVEDAGRRRPVSGSARQVEALARPREVGVGDAAQREPAARALLELGACVWRILTTPAPTVPSPRRPILIVVHGADAAAPGAHRRLQVS